MTDTADDFLTMARSAVDLLREPAVADAWDGPSALPQFGVGPLAGHLIYQILAVEEALAAPVPQERTVSLLEHYERVEWIGAALEDAINVRIRQGGERIAAQGPAALVARAEDALRELAGTLDAADRPVRIPLWGPWSLTLHDLLITRMMELAVHCDDLAVSVRLPAPPLPSGAAGTVIGLLSRLAVRRHGTTAVLRALSRAERAPSSIAAF